MSSTLVPPVVAAAEDECLTILGLPWSSYIAINDAVGDQPKLRLLYLDGGLTLLSPARRHSWSEDVLDKIVLAVAVACQIEMDVVGNATIRKEDREAGLEGDKVYYLGANATLMAGPLEIDLAIHPPPDLAIEVENTHKATGALRIYARLGVPEVWRHDVRRGTLGFFALQPDGTYTPIPRSLGFPCLTPTDLLFQVDQAAAIGSHIRWFAQLNDWARDVIRPRLDPA